MIKNNELKNESLLINYINILFFNLKFQVVNPSSTLIKHKMAVLYLTFFLFEFPMKWPRFFEDLLQSCCREDIDNFLRVLIYICDEIGERDTPFKDELHKRNTNLKDAMREGNILQSIFKKIQEILVSHYYFLLFFNNNNFIYLIFF